MKRLITAFVVGIMGVFLLLGMGLAQDGTPKVTKPIPVVPSKDKEQVDPKLPAVPIAPEKKVTDPPPAGDSDGVLPWAYVKNRIETMPIGTKAYINVDAVKCDSKRKVYLDPDQLYGIKNEDRVVQISRDETGYHVLLEEIGHQWVCQELPPGQKVLPVKSVTTK